MLKFKIGDVVEITYNTCYHGFDIGEKVRITKTLGQGQRAYYDGVNLDSSQEWSFSDEDCKATQGE